MTHGTLRANIISKNVKECIGNIFPEDYPEVNFLMDYYVKGMMEQPDFNRAIDTVGNNIRIYRNMLFH